MHTIELDVNLVVIGCSCSCDSNKLPATEIQSICSSVVLFCSRRDLLKKQERLDLFSMFYHLYIFSWNGFENWNKWKWFWQLFVGIAPKNWWMAGVGSSKYRYLNTGNINNRFDANFDKRVFPTEWCHTRGNQWTRFPAKLFETGKIAAAAIGIWNGWLAWRNACRL